MKKISPTMFEVVRNEEVEIKVQPVSVGPFVAAANAGKPLVDQSPTKKYFLFRFKISSAVDLAEVTKIAGQFMGSEAKTARYEITISSVLGQSFTMAPIRKPASKNPSERSRQYTFVVTQ